KMDPPKYEVVSVPGLDLSALVAYERRKHRGSKVIYTNVILSFDTITIHAPEAIYVPSQARFMAIGETGTVEDGTATTRPARVELWLKDKKLVTEQRKRRS